MTKPDRHEMELYAHVSARLKSNQDKNVPYYVYHNNSGYYLVDTSAGAYTDETLIATYLNGQKK